MKKFLSWHTEGVRERVYVRERDIPLPSFH